MVSWFKGLAKRKKGFTLIELLAVMAILAVLLAVVAPAVTGSREASINAQALQDASQVRTAATNEFAARNEAEIRTPHSVTLTTKVNALAVLKTEQEISSRWPEKFITTQSNTLFPAKYAEVFPTSASTTNGVVVNVNLLDKKGVAVTGATILGDFTAIDVDTLITNGRLGNKPEGIGAASKTTLGGVEYSIPNFLWLFEKKSSSTATEDVDDSRDVAVFSLVKVEQNESTAGYAAKASTIDLTYQRIF